MTAVVAGNSSGQGSGTAARTITYPASIGASDLVLAFILWQTAATTMTVPTGFTAVVNNPVAGSGGQNMWIGWRVGSAGGTTYTPSGTCRDVWFTLRLTGADTTTPVNVGAVGAASANSATAISSPTATTTVGDTLDLHVYVDNVAATGTAASFTTPTSTTLDGSLSSTLAVSTTRWAGGLIVHDTAAHAVAGATTARASTAAAGNLQSQVLSIAPGAAAAAGRPVTGPRSAGSVAVMRSALY